MFLSKWLLALFFLFLLQYPQIMSAHTFFPFWQYVITFRDVAIYLLLPTENQLFPVATNCVCIDMLEEMLTLFVISS